MPYRRSGLLEQQLSHEQVINKSGFEISSQGALPPLRKGYYYTVVGQAIAGDAPKDFIRAYTYGKAKRSNPRKWPAYIAKVGHKWYPNESIDPERLPAFIDRYVKNSHPKTGWDDENNPNHFSLIQNIHHAYPDLRPVLSALCRPQLLEKVQEILDSEFRLLMSTLRRTMILNCLKRRLDLISDALTKDVPCYRP